MKLFFLATLVMCGLTSSAQKKPTFPPDYYEGFQFRLDSNLDINDSAAVRRQTIRIAMAMDAYVSKAMKEYSITDSTVLYDLVNYKWNADNILGRPQAVIKGIYTVRRMRPASEYRAPNSYQHLAYNKALLLHPDDRSTAFRAVYSREITNEINRFPAAFKNDLVNQQKGIFQLSMVTNTHKYLTDIYEQAMSKGKGLMDFVTANSALTFYFLDYQMQYYQPLVEGILYKINPSRVKEMNVRIPMRDSIHLNAYVYRDEASKAKVPAVISLSPYPSGTEATKGNVFATNGYVYVYVDTRGRRQSEGNFIPYEDDARDYYDIIEWASKQPWCDGQVATTGGSYLGFDQWQALRKEYKHPALKAANPMVSVGFGIDFPRLSNMFYPYILQWAVFVSGKDLNEALFDDWRFWERGSYKLYKENLPFSKLDSVTGIPSPIFQKWVSHPSFDSYWKGILPKETDYAAIDIPVFTITGYYDADQLGAMYYYDNHMKYGSAAAKKKHQLLIGPWNHGGSQWQPGPFQNGRDIEKEAQVPIYKYVIWWYDWVLKGKPKPAFIKNNVTYFETANHQWKGAASIQSITKDSIELYLSPTLVNNRRRKNLYALDLAKPATSSSVEYSHNITEPLDSAFLYAYPEPQDDSLDLASPYNLMFESNKLGKDIFVSDKIVAQLFMSLNVPDADFIVTVQEVLPDGKVYNLADARIRVRYRNGGDQEELAKPGEVITLNFTDSYIYLKKIKGGSKIRLQFRSMNEPWSEKNYGFGGVVAEESIREPRIIRASIKMDPLHPSKLVIPVSARQ